MSLEAHPKEGLIRLLRTDFSICGDPTNRDLVMQRELSLENTHIGQQVESLLAGACISGMGQRAIVARMQQAHAEMTRVPSEISPSALGLDEHGLGIYDPILAPDLEARLYRASLFREIQELLTVSSGSFSMMVETLMVETFATWGRDFIETHGKEPMDYAKLDPLALAHQEGEIDPDSFLGQIIREAQRFNDGEPSINPQFSDN